MNYWNEPYPTSIESLIRTSNEKLEELLAKLNDKNCKTLDDLYKVNSTNQEIQRQKKVFDELGYKPNAKLNEKAKKDNELKGLYLFGEITTNGTIPRYVGISGTIFRRLKQHGWGKLHNEATLAYLKASSKMNYTGERKDMELKEIQSQQQIIRQYRVALLPEKLDYDLYFMEVYFAGQLKTLWNSFKTH